MLSRVRLALTAAAAVMAAVAIVISIREATRHAQQGRNQAGVPAPLAAGTALERPRPVPPIRLVEGTGRAISLAAFRGKWVILAPSLTLCHEVCPMTTGVLMQLASRLGGAGIGKQVVVATATVDPWRDSPARLRAYRRLSGASFTMLTGSQQEIRRLWSFFGVYYKQVPQGKPPDVDWMTHRPETFDVLHSNGFFILDPVGQERIVDQGMPNVGSRRNLSPQLRSLLNEQGQRNLVHPQFSWSAGDLLDDLYYLMNKNVPRSSAQESAPTPAAAAGALAGSPPTLTALHAQAGRLLGPEPALTTELKLLRGYPVVINAWASWCAPCRAEFTLFGAASARYGRRVAFLGSDMNDSSTDARRFLAQHPVSYPSYQSTTGALRSLAVLEGLPTTIFLAASGRVVFVHTGQYQTQATLDQDIERYALPSSGHA